LGASADEEEAMTTQPLLARLRALDRSKLMHGPPARPEDLAQLAHAIGQPLPEDFRASVLELGGWMVKGPRFTISVELIDVITMILRDEDWNDRMPGMMMFGSDGGDCWYYYDPLDKLGHGAFAVYLVERGAMTLAHSMYIAKTLTEATECVLAGERLYDRPYLSP
jgi:hypothetical protein